MSEIGFSCFEYVFELSFMTGAFIYTDLGDFELEEFNSTTTTLRYNVGFNNNSSTTDVYSCLEGLVQIPGQTYTLTVVHPDDPTDIISTQTFTLPTNAVDIGVNGQTTFLSAAIGVGLLPANIAINTPQTIIVHGTLIVDQGYTFGSMMGSNALNLIAFAQGAEIIVDIQDPTEEFFINNGHLFPCDESWNGIQVNDDSRFRLRNSILEKADIGIELMDGSSLISAHNIIKECEIGIASLGNNLKIINLILSQGGGFDKHVIIDCEIGLKLENVQNLITLFSPNNNLIFQNNKEAGIQIGNCNFRGYGLFLGYNRVGLQVDAPNVSITLDRGLVYNNEYGVSINGSVYSEITRCSFQRNSQIDVARVNQIQDVSYIWHSEFGTESGSDPGLADDLCQTNIWAGLYPSVLGGVIQDNEMYAKFSNASIFGFSGSNHNWAIQHNSLLYAIPQINSNAGNVSLYNTRDCRIFRNLNTYGSKYNFRVGGGENSYIGYNNAISLANNSKSLRLQASPGALIYCNNIEGEGIGLYLNNNCNGSEIRGNDFDGSYMSMSYGLPPNHAGMTGEQNLNGNRFHGPTINFSSTDVAQLSQYIVPQGSIYGSTIFPIFTSDFDTWFDDSGLFGEYTCPPGEPNPVINEYGRLLKIAKTNMKLLEGQFDANLTGELGYDARLKLYRALTRLEAYGSLDEGQQAWKDELSTPPIASFIEIEQMFDQTISLTESETEAYNDHLDNIRDYSLQADNIVWFEIDTTEGDTIIYFPIQQAQLESLQQSIVSEVNGLAAISQPKKEALVNIVGQLNEINDGINNITTTSGKFQQIVNTVLFKRYANLAISLKDVKYLEGIAKYCVGNGGEAVYTARALLAEYDKQYSFKEYNDECIQIKRKGDDKRFNKNRPNLTGALTIYPNPATDLLQITLAQPDLCTRLNIYNIHGKFVMTKDTDGQNTVNLNISPLSPGIYFVKTDNAQIPTQKFEVVK